MASMNTKMFSNRTKWRILSARGFFVRKLNYFRQYTIPAMKWIRKFA